MFNGLEGLITLASYLFLGVLWKETVCVFFCKGVICDKSVKCSIS